MNNGKRRRLDKLRRKAVARRRSPTPKSATLSQLAIENAVPNRATRRMFRTPTWYKANDGR